MATTMEEINATAVATWLTKDSVNASLNNIPLLYLAKEKGRFKTVDFSAGLKVPTVLARKQVKATDGSGTGMTVHNDQANYAAEVPWCTVPVKVIITKDVLDLSKSSYEVVSAVTGQMISSQSAVLNTLNNMIFGDGTGDSGKAITGLAAAISKTPAVGVYAGIDPAVVRQWRNYAANALDPASGLPNAGAALDSDNVLDVIDFVINRLANNGRSISHILVGDTYYNMISKAIRAMQTLSAAEVAKAGFRILTYAGVMIVNCGGLKRDSDLSPVYTGIGEKEMYFITLDDIWFATHNPFNYGSELKKFGIKQSDINAFVYPEMHNGMILHKDPDTLDYYINLVYKGNMVLGDRKIHGIVYEEAITP